MRGCCCPYQGVECCPHPRTWADRTSRAHLASPAERPGAGAPTGLQSRGGRAITAGRFDSFAAPSWRYSRRCDRPAASRGRPPPRARATSSQRIDAAIAAARAGSGRGVVVEGPAGIGKSAVLAAARRSARGRRDARAARPRRRARARLRLRRRAPALRAGARTRRRRPSATICCRARRGWPRGVLGLPGARRRARRRRRRPTRRSRSCTASTGCARTSPPSSRSCSASTTPTGPTRRRCASSPSCCPRLEELPVALLVATPARGRGRGGAPARAR